MNIEAFRVQPYALRFTTPIRCARGEFTHRCGWLIEVIADGESGYGDAACWPGFGSTPDQLANAVATLTGSDLVGAPFESLSDVEAALASLPDDVPELRYAVELALLDRLGRKRGVSIAQLLFDEPATAVNCHALVTGTPRHVTHAHYKVKVAHGSLDSDERRIAELRSSLGASARLRLDAGGGWSEEQAVEAIERLARYDIAWLEQPVATIDSLARVRTVAKRHGIAIAADESVSDYASVERIIASEAADGIVIKPMFVGGLLASHKLAQLAHDAGLDTMVTNALESAIGRAGAVHLASGLPVAAAASGRHVHGLGSALAEDIATLVERDGVIAVPGCGLGVRPHERTDSTPDDCSPIPNPLASAALAYPNRIALETPAQSLTYAELASLAARGATALRGRGIAPGMTVALVGGRHAAWVVAFHAIGWLGCAVAPIGESLPAQERTHLLNAIAPDAVLRAEDVLGMTADTTTPPADERPWPRDSVRWVICTSGTTGTPRAVSITTQQLLLSAFASAIRIGHTPSDRWLCVLPLHHVGGASIVMRCAFYGTSVVLEPRFDAARTAQQLDSGSISLVSLVPAMLERVLAVREARPFPPALRAIVLGGAAASSDLVAQCRAINAPVALTWGMTEAASQVATREPGDLSLPIDAGSALPFGRVSEEAGRLAVEGPIVAGRLVTGDLGSVRAGRVVVTGRADDLINSGGVKIAPEQIEQALLEHPAIREAVVTAIPSTQWGQRPAAALVSIDQHTQPSDGELSSWCRQRVGSVKVPDRFVWCRSLPKCQLGKISRRRVGELLRELARESVDESTLTQRGDEGCGGSAGHEPLELDERVHQTRGAADLSVQSTQRVEKTDRALPQTLDLEGDIDTVSHPQRTLKVGLGVHQRHADALRLEHAFDVETQRRHQLFIGGVAVLEHPGEKHDPGPIGLEETNRNAMNERHDDDAR